MLLKFWEYLQPCHIIASWPLPSIIADQQAQRVWVSGHQQSSGGEGWVTLSVLYGTGAESCNFLLSQVPRDWGVQGPWYHSYQLCNFSFLNLLTNTFCISVWKLMTYFLFFTNNIFDLLFFILLVTEIDSFHKWEKCGLPSMINKKRIIIPRIKFYPC